MSGTRDEVLIVGGGVIGLACAWYLLGEGRAVRVLERTHVGAGSSHGNCGTLTPSHAPPLAAPGTLGKALRGMLHADSALYIRPRWDPALASWLLRFAGRCTVRDWQAATRGKAALLNLSRQLIESLVAAQALDCEFADSGLVYVFRDPRAHAKCVHELEALRAFGIAAEVWDPARLAAEEPALLPGMAGGVHFPGDASLRPDRFVAELARIVRAAGGVIEEGAVVTGIEAGADRCRLQLDDGGHRDAAQAVLAAGAWSPRLARTLPVKLPVQPGKGYSITYTPPATLPRRPLVLKERSVCVTGWSRGFRLGSTMEFSGYDERLNRTRLDALVRGAREYLREPEGPQRIEEWFGWRPMTWDDLPVIGPVPGHPRLWMATGHGMMGVSMSAGTGRLLADLLCGREPTLDPRPYRVERFPA